MSSNIKFNNNLDNNNLYNSDTNQQNIDTQATNHYAVKAIGWAVAAVAFAIFATAAVLALASVTVGVAVFTFTANPIVFLVATPLSGSATLIGFMVLFSGSLGLAWNSVENAKKWLDAKTSG